MTDRLQARGLPGASTTLKKLYDINGAVGGPIKQDGVVLRHIAVLHERVLPGRSLLPDRRHGDSAQNDTSQQAYAGTYTYDNNGRVTWGSPRSRRSRAGMPISTRWTRSGSCERQPVSGSRRASRRGTRSSPPRSGPTRRRTGCCSRRAWWLVQAPTPSCSIRSRSGRARAGILAPRCIAIVNQTAGFTYRAPTTFDFDDRLPSQTINVSGQLRDRLAQRQGRVRNAARLFLARRQQRLHGGCGTRSTSWPTGPSSPAFVNINAPATGWQDNLNYNLGHLRPGPLDDGSSDGERWCPARLPEHLHRAVYAGPASLAAQPQRAFDAVENVPNWKDVNPRVSAAYDLFGNGKTAIKGSASRGVQQESIAIARANNPANTVATTTSARGPTADNDFVPDCDLVNACRQRRVRCLPEPELRQRRAGASLRQRPSWGWGVRPWNWEFSAGVQQELCRAYRCRSAYFRRINGNFRVTDNEALSRTDFTQYPRPSRRRHARWHASERGAGR